MKKIIIPVLLSLSYLLTGCAVTVETYNASEENSQYLKSLNTPLNVNKFTANKSDFKVMCRLANNVATPDNEPFETYIENALIDELKMAGMYSKDSPVTINGHLIDTDASSGMSDGHWTFNIEVSTNNKKGFTVIHKREYSGSFFGGKACRHDMPRAFAPTVKELIAKIIHHPEFLTLIGK